MEHGNKRHFKPIYMQTLTIQIPEGFEIDTLDTKTGQVKFKPKPKKVTERIKTVADVLADHNLSQQQFDAGCEDLEPDEKAYRILKLLAKSLNEGWTPDWNDDRQDKWYAWFYMGGSSGFRCNDYGAWNAYSAVGSRLCFKSRELAEHAGKNFTEVYKQFMTIQ
jgi:hypothetical protein